MQLNSVTRSETKSAVEECIAPRKLIIAFRPFLLFLVSTHFSERKVSFEKESEKITQSSQCRVSVDNNNHRTFYGYNRKGIEFIDIKMLGCKVGRSFFLRQFSSFFFQSFFRFG